MSRLEMKKKLEAALELAMSCLKDVPRTDFVICGVTRGEDKGEGA